MKRQIVWLVASCLMVVALLSASCAPAATTTPPTTTPPTTTPPTTTPPPTTPTKEEPQYGGTLTILTYLATYEPQSWDLNDIFWLTGHYNSMFQENLLAGDLSRGPRGSNEYPLNSLEYVPEELWIGHLAESWEMPDDTTIIFHVRKGVMFPDKPGVMSSREMTADDVAFTFNRLFSSPKLLTGILDYVKSVTASDKYTVVFKVSGFDADWRTGIGCWFALYGKIYPPELVKAGATNWRNATGTGPFMLKDYVSGASITYQKNPIYWGKIALGGREYRLPFVDRLVLPIMTDESTRLAALRTGKVDIAESVSWKYKDSLQQTNPELLRFRMLGGSTTLIAMRVDTKPFDDIRVRRAMSMAIDRDAYTKTQMGGEGEILSFAYESYWPETLYTPLEKLPQSARELFKYSPDKAKELLAEAGYPKGFQTEIVIPSGVEDATAMLCAYWKDIGVGCAIKTYAYGTWTSIMYGKTHKQMLSVAKGKGGPFTTLDAIAGSYLGGYDAANFNTPKFDELYWKAKATKDIVERYKLCKEMNVYVIDQCPYIILPTAYTYRYAWPWVKNYYGESNAGAYYPGPCYAQFWLDRDLREKMTGKR